VFTLICQRTISGNSSIGIVPFEEFTESYELADRAAFLPKVSGVSLLIFSNVFITEFGDVFRKTRFAGYGEFRFTVDEEFL